MLNVIICGAPGCGKGTQSELIVAKYNLKHVSTGELLRIEINNKTEMGLIADRLISKGNFVPDAMVIDMIIKIMDENKNCGLLLDGFPRTYEQAIAFESILKERNNQPSVLINLDVENEELVTRLLARGKTSGRSDDVLDTIRKRLKIYHLKTEPMIQYYESLGNLYHINGMGSVDDVFSRVSDVLDTKDIAI